MTAHYLMFSKLAWVKVAIIQMKMQTDVSGQNFELNSNLNAKVHFAFSFLCLGRILCVKLKVKLLSPFHIQFHYNYNRVILRSARKSI